MTANPFSELWPWICVTSITRCRGPYNPKPGRVFLPGAGLVGVNPGYIGHRSPPRGHSSWPGPHLGGSRCLHGLITQYTHLSYCFINITVCTTNDYNVFHSRKGTQDTFVQCTEKNSSDFDSDIYFVLKGVHVRSRLSRFCKDLGMCNRFISGIIDRPPLTPLSTSLRLTTQHDFNVIAFVLSRTCSQ